jgi:hypothetical protein
VLFLFSHVPLRPRHLVIVAPPLAALSGMAVAAGLDHATTRAARTALTVLTVAVIGALGLASAQAAIIPDFVDAHPARAAVIRYIQATTAPDDCIVSKENRLHFRTGRLSTPYLSEVSTARLASGLLTGDAVMAEIAAHDCAALVYSDSFDHLAPTLRAAAQAHYALELRIEDAQDSDPIPVYAVPMHTTAPPDHPVQATLGDTFVLHGYDLTPAPWTPGQPVYLSTYWSARQAPAADYKIFVHLVDEAGQLVQGLDHYPFADDPAYQIAQASLTPGFLAQSGAPLPDDYPASGLIPTRSWIPGSVLKETIRFEPPAAGSYTLRIGLYDPLSLARLAVDDALPGGVYDQIDLATVEVR